jgi:hypothetical protein
MKQKKHLFIEQEALKKDHRKIFRPHQISQEKGHSLQLLFHFLPRRQQERLGLQDNLASGNEVKVSTRTWQGIPAKI